MSSRSAEPTGSGPLQVHVLEAKEVCIPIAVSPGGGEMAPEAIELRADFLAGKQLSREQMGRLLRETDESLRRSGGNCNCNIC